jgi:diaminopimelate decarboxylase
MKISSYYSQIESHPTPFYFYNISRLNQTLSQISSAAQGYNVHYAVKANANIEILKTISSAGLGADCVSGAEVEMALKAGFSPKNIAFAGVGKTDFEITTALKSGIFSLNVESIPELQIINEIAQGLNLVAPVAIRINPNVNANTHKYITTGLEENKFGINLWEVPQVVEIIKQSKHLKFIGLHFHIGSQIKDLEPFKALCLRANEIQELFAQKGLEGSTLNLGGGLGIDYDLPDETINPDFNAFFNIFRKWLNPRPNQEVHFELGRSVVANCGTLISRVLYVKKGVKTNFLILDAGMTELIRPALYQAYHKIENITAENEGVSNLEFYDVVGPVCESSDCFGKKVKMRSSKRNDIIAIRSAGAYGEVMSSNYNLRKLNPSLFIR